MNTNSGIVAMVYFITLSPIAILVSAGDQVDAVVIKPCLARPSIAHDRQGLFAQ